MKTFSRKNLKNLNNTAASSQRKRQHYNFHENYDEKCQKLINAIGTDSYIRPHRHSNDPKNEFLYALSGLFSILIFNDEGKIESVEFLCSDNLYNYNIAVEIVPQSWHTVIALKDNSALLEVKDGPFRPEYAKEFPDWAPAENSIESIKYLNKLKSYCLKKLD